MSTFMKLQIPKHADLIGFLGIVTIWLFECFLAQQAEIRFTADSERDLFQVLALTKYGRIPDSGILMAALGWDLGPLYFFLLAPINAIWPHPIAIYTLNVTINTFGLLAAFWVVRTQLGKVSALFFALLYTQSAGHFAMTDTVWHVGAAPGVALGYFASAWWWVQSGRTRALVIASALLTLLIQIHALAMVFVPCSLMLLWWHRQHLTKHSLAWLLGTVLVTALPLLIYLVPSLVNTGGSAARHGGGLGFDPAQFGHDLIALTRPKYLLNTVMGGLMALGLTAIGASRTLALTFQRKHQDKYRMFLLAQWLLGACIVSMVVEYEGVGRYYLPVLYPTFFLMALGVSDLEQWLVHRGRTATGRQLTWGVVFIALVTVPPTSSQSFWKASELPTDYLSLHEQDAVVKYLTQDQQLSWPQIRHRVHGVFLGPLTGIRYLERIYRESTEATNASPPTEEHWMVVPESLGFHPAEDTISHTKILTPAGRKIAVYRYKPALKPESVEGEKGPCSWIFPYLWSEQKTEVLKLVGFPAGHGPDIHHCFKNGSDGVLKVPIRKAAGAITIQISDDGHFNGEKTVPVRVTLVTAGYPKLPLSPNSDHQFEEKRWMTYIYPSHDGERHLEIHLTPRGNLAFIDAF